MEITKVVIIGAGGLAREVLDVINAINAQNYTIEVLGFIDENPKTHGKILNGIPVLGDLSWFSTVITKDIKAICGIGNNEKRKKITQKIEGLRVEFISVIHPSVQMGYGNKIGKGVVICAGCIITCNTIIGNHVYINLDCTVGHDTVLEDYVNLAPSVNVSGNCTLLEGTHVYTNAVIIPPVVLGKWSIIGAGAVVLKSIPDYAVAVGTPAKVKKIRDK